MVKSGAIGCTKSRIDAPALFLDLDALKYNIRENFYYCRPAPPVSR
jgi:hypothetical protein